MDEWCVLQFLKDLPEVMQAVCGQVWFSLKGLACCITLSCFWKCCLQFAISPFLKVPASSASSWLAQHKESQKVCPSGLQLGSHAEEIHHRLSLDELCLEKITIFCCFLAMIFNSSAFWNQQGVISGCGCNTENKISDGEAAVNLA